MHLQRHHSSIPRGFTLIESITALVAAAVLAAIIAVTWRSQALQEHRGDAVRALLALQSAQDKYFGQHARYASSAQLAAEPPAGLGISPLSRQGYYAITVRNSDDNLGYWATARVLPNAGKTQDARCVELRIDQNGRRYAIDAAGEDRSADCWR